MGQAYEIQRLREVGLEVRTSSCTSKLHRMARSNSISSDPGSLAGSIARYKKQSLQITRDLEKLADQQEDLRASMVARFAKADSQVAASKSTLSFLQSQIDIWNSQGD